MDKIFTPDWNQREEAVQRFEEAWRKGRRPRIDKFLPGDYPDNLSILIELIHVDMECRLKSGIEARVEAYLERYPELANQNEEVLELIVAEIKHRLRSEPKLTMEEYGQRFPQYKRDLQSRWPTTDPRKQDNKTISLPAFTEDPAPEKDDSPWPRVAGYEVLDELGRGGMGVVYRALHIKLKRPVALKMILAGCHARPEQLARFRAEAEAVARFQHPHIVQIHDIGDQAGMPFLALELVEGGSLAQKIDGTPWRPAAAAELIKSLAAAMAYAHQRGIIHRDLKPANILLSRHLEVGNRQERSRTSDLRLPTSDLDSEFPNSELDPKITDFGLAKRLDEVAGNTATGSILGTPSYMAPEQAGGKTKELGPAVDVYALGAILYELLTGRPPFKAATPLDTLMQVQTEEPLPPARLQPNLSPDLETICLKCLDKDPRRRYFGAADLAEDLRRFLDGEPILAKPASSWNRSIKWIKRRPAGAALIAVSSLALIGFIVGGLITNSRLKAEKNAEEWQKQRAEKALAESRQRLTLNYIAYGRLCASASRLATARDSREREEALSEFMKVRAWLAIARDETIEPALVRFEKALQEKKNTNDLTDLSLDLAHACRESWLNSIDHEVPAMGGQVRAQLYRRACAVTSSLARAKSLENAERDLREFWELYWGELAIVESKEVEIAMVHFGRFLDDWVKGPPPAELAQLADNLRKACGLPAEKE